MLAHISKGRIDAHLWRAQNRFPPSGLKAVVYFARMVTNHDIYVTYIQFQLLNISVGAQGFNMFGGNVRKCNDAFTCICIDTDPNQLY